MTNWQEIKDYQGTTSQNTDFMEDWLSARSKASPQSLALLYEGCEWTYADLNAAVTKICTPLSAKIKPGCHVGTLLPSNPLTVVIIHTLARIGAVMVPLNTRLSERELLWQIEQSNCQVVLYTTETAELAANLSLRSDVMLQVDTLNLAKFKSTATAPNNFKLNNLQAIVFTSGTTGSPKGAMLTFANHFWSATASAYRLGVCLNDRWLSCLPLYHVGGLAIIFRSCLYGTAIVLHRRFDVKAVSDSLDSDGITLTSLVPTMMHRLLDYRQGRPWPNSIRHLLLGGAAANADLLNHCRELNVPVSTTYGLTEAASQVATALPEETLNKPGTVGKPLLFSTVRIVNEDRVPLPNGQIGEITVSGPTIMAGYYENAQATSGALIENQLFTGDIGYLDDDGDLFVLQRRSDIIICGGENIYPAELEQIFRGHPDITDVCIVGLPDQEWGQRVGAMIKLEENRSLSEEQILNFGRQFLASYKLPKLIKIVDQLPQTASGKIQRKLVADQFGDMSP